MSDNLAESVNQLTERVERAETGVYILAGVFGGLILIILCFLIYVVTAVEKLEKKIKSVGLHPNRKGKTNPEPVYDDIERRFTQYPPVRARIDDRSEQRPYVSNLNSQAQEVTRNPLTQQQQQYRSNGAKPTPMDMNPVSHANDTHQQPRGLRNYDNYGY